MQRRFAVLKQIKTPDESGYYSPTNIKYFCIPDNSKQAHQDTYDGGFTHRDFTLTKKLTAFIIITCNLSIILR